MDALFPLTPHPLCPAVPATQPFTAEITRFAWPQLSPLAFAAWLQSADDKPTNQRSVAWPQCTCIFLFITLPSPPLCTRPPRPTALSHMYKNNTKIFVWSLWHPQVCTVTRVSTFACLLKSFSWVTKDEHTQSSTRAHTHANTYARFQAQEAWYRGSVLRISRKPFLLCSWSWGRKVNRQFAMTAPRHRWRVLHRPLSYLPSCCAAPPSVKVLMKMPSFSRPASAPTPMPMMLSPRPSEPAQKRMLVRTFEHKTALEARCANKIPKT